MSSVVFAIPSNVVSDVMNAYTCNNRLDVNFDGGTNDFLIVGCILLVNRITLISIVKEALDVSYDGEGKIPRMS